MALILPRFEYDIFISYRHNDNRSGWVTEFINVLQEELAATIKEPLKVYFDKDPKDGLLETHNVDKSLEGKLKSLIFIPIISRTYCDTKSFAWQYEFCGFNRLARQDHYGLDVRLSNGNVASRILPIKIHDLDSEDKALIENELGAILRGIEFIYREPGVNRPLKSTDNKTDNHNKTDYRNQVNKVANTIKEIIDAAVKAPLKISSPFQQRLRPINEKSMVVLPFMNMSNDPEQEYFSDGITEDIIAHLSKVTELRVISRTSAMRYKKSDRLLREISEDLNVSYALEGSVRKYGNRLRIVAQLVEAQTEKHLWAETFDRELTDVFAVQSELAQKIVELLKSKLTLQEKSRIEKPMTQNLEAYNLFLLGRNHFNQVNPKAFVKAIQFLDMAIDRDPFLAQAYATKGMVNMYMGAGYWGVKPRDAWAKATELATKALKIDPYVSEALHVMAEYEHWIEYDFSEAGRKLERAIEINPGFAFHYIGYGFHKVTIGQFEEAIGSYQHAINLDPVSPAVLGNGAFFYYAARRFEESLSEANVNESYNPDDPWTNILRGSVLIATGRPDEAVNHLQSLAKNFPGTWSLIFLAWSLAAAGRNTEAQHLLEELRDREKTEYLWGPGIAFAYAHLGNIDTSIEYFEKSIDDRAGWMNVAGIFPAFDIIRDHPKFNTLLERNGIFSKRVS